MSFFGGWRGLAMPLLLYCYSQNEFCVFLRVQSTFIRRAFLFVTKETSVALSEHVVVNTHLKVVLGSSVSIKKETLKH